MAESNEKEAGYNSGSSDTESQQNQLIFERPTGLKGLYSHPVTQVSILGFVCFMCPGVLL